MFKPYAIFNSDAENAARPVFAPGAADSSSIWNRIDSQYKTIGSALLAYERSARAIPARPERLVLELRENLAFTQVEILESYLEDLLDLDRSESELFIDRSFILSRSVPLSLSGLFSAVFIGMYLVGEGIPLAASSAISSLLSVPFLVLFYVSPRGALARRLMFAQVLSLEIARRRGRDKGEAPRGFSPSLIVGGLFQSKLRPSQP